MRQEKQLLLDELLHKMSSHHSFLLLRYQAMAANTAHAFRGAVVNLGGEFEVIRKRVFAKAAERANVTLPLEAMEGHLGVLFVGGDSVQTTKAVMQFGEQNEGMMSIVGGRLEGRFYSGTDVEKLSKLPGLNEMRAQLLGLFEAPMAQTLGVMDALLTSIIYCLENKAKQSN